MFEFFIALFGGLFWGGKIHKEKSETKRAQSDFETTMAIRNARRSEFERKVIDRELEADLEDFVYNTSNYDKVWSEVSKAFDEMPWKPDDEKFICICPEAVDAVFGKGTYTKKQKEQIAANYRKEALRIMMANRGKLMWNDARFGIHTIGDGAPTTRIAEQWNKETANFILWINQKLKDHGVNEMVLLEFGCGYNNWYQITEENKIKCGTYHWFPEIMTNININP